MVRVSQWYCVGGIQLYVAFLPVVSWATRLQRKATDNTVQGEPTCSISTTRGFPTSGKTEFDRLRRAHHEYPTFVTLEGDRRIPLRVKFCQNSS